MRNITIQNKNMHYMYMKKITSAANQNQPVHRIIETSSFMSLLRAQLVANTNVIIGFPIWTVKRAYRIDDQVADQSPQSINHEYQFGVIFH